MPNNRPSKTRRRNINAPFVFGSEDEVRMWDKERGSVYVKMKQVFANRDIPHLGVKVGDEGGWMCRDSKMCENSWIGPETRLYKSSLYSSYIPGETKVSHCDIFRSNVFGYGNLRESDIHGSTITGTIVQRSIIRDSNVECDQIEQSKIYECYVRLRDSQGYRYEKIQNREYNRLILFENVPQLTFLDRHEVKVLYLDIKRGPIVRVGCTKFYLSEWLKRYKEEGQENSYDEYSQKQYLAALKYIRTWWGMYKEKWASALAEVEQTGWTAREELKLEGQNNEQ